jgi:hypothetical protein
MIYISGLDLGQTNDPTALAVLEQTGAGKEKSYGVRYLERFPLGTSYTAICALVAQRMKPLPGSTLAVDQTGVGRPVVDLLRGSKMNVSLRPITITAGHTARRDEETRDWHVPKKDLVACLHVLFGSKRLKILKSLPDAALLVKELDNFSTKITLAANEVYGPLREGQHDDLVLAVALACWVGEHLITGPWEPTTDPRARMLTADIFEMQF